MPINFETLSMGYKTGAIKVPGSLPGQTEFTFTGGEVSSAFPNLINLWDTKKQWNTDTGRDEWAINLPVYQASSSSSCNNPSGSITIVGYAKAVITTVKKNDIQAEVKCDTFFNGAPSPTQTGGGYWTPSAHIGVSKTRVVMRREQRGA